MPKLVTLLNGPNLNLLGLRQPEIYGRETLDDVVARVADLAEELGLTVRALQSNHEGQLVDWIQEARGKSAGSSSTPAPIPTPRSPSSTR
jgi:3-dehydroquinate dehydratase-2